MKAFTFILLAYLIILLASCAKQSTTPTKEGTIATPSGAQALSSTPEALASARGTVLGVSYTDISGTYEERAVENLGSLGVLDSTSGAFHPSDPIKRAEFVRWLMKANNIFYKDDPTQQIRLAEGNEATFVDVLSSSSDFKYIQGLANAGYVIGIDARHFAPDVILTREQMIGIKAARDAGGSNTKNVSPQFLQMRVPATDSGRIGKHYWGAVYDDFSAATSGNFRRVYGSVKSLNPQKPVTRGEAALALSVFGGEIPQRSAAQMLGVSAPSP